MNIKEFFKNLICFECIEHNKTLEINQALLKKNNKKLESDIDKLMTLNQEIEKKYQISKNQLQTLLASKTIKLNEIKEWYETKYMNGIWRYKIDGETLQDAKLALRHTKQGEKILQEAAQELIQLYKLNKNNKPEAIISRVMQYFMAKSRWTYMFDNQQFRKREYWEIAEISWQTRIGDCDDLAILMHKLIAFIFRELGMYRQHYWRLKYTASSTLVEGHAYNIWLHDDGEWYVIESTLDLGGSFRKTWLQTPIRKNNMYFNFWGFAREDKSWPGTNRAVEPK